jgi:ABC-type branched-subunit amino acid transport system ATPase component
MKLSAHNIEKAYKGRKVVKGISLEVSQGEIVGLLGPNGAGKTTSFYMIVGLIKPNNGSIFLNDQEITKVPNVQKSTTRNWLFSSRGLCVQKIECRRKYFECITDDRTFQNSSKRKNGILIGRIWFKPYSQK